MTLALGLLAALAAWLILRRADPAGRRGRLAGARGAAPLRGPTAGGGHRPHAAGIPRPLGGGGIRRRPPGPGDARLADRQPRRRRGGRALPYAVFLQRAVRRRAAIQQALVEAVAQLRDAIRVGHSQQQALVFLATDGPEALQRQFNRLALDIQTGGFERALTRWQAALADPLADQVAEALRIANRKGGERLSDVLQRLVETTRADFRIRQQIRAMQTQGVWQARLICAMPLFILVAMRRINPEAMAIFDRPLGQLILAGSALWLLVGYLWMLAAIRVRQPNRLFVPELEEAR